MKNLIIRGVSGIIFVGLLISGILYSHSSFAFLFAIVSAMAVHEFCTLVHTHKHTTFSKELAMLAGTMLFFATYGATYIYIEKPLILFIPYILLCVFIFIRELYRIEGGVMNNYAYFTLSQVYAVLPFAMLNILAAYGGNGYNYIMPLAIFIFIWSNDTGAFCVGCTIGKHKMFKRISPKKSWEGFVGGAVTAIVAGYILSLFFDVLNAWQWMGMAAVVVASGTLGDLIESCMKREIGIKDSGNIMPGHGGILDRFDSTILAIPCVIAYLYLI